MMKRIVLFIFLVSILTRWVFPQQREPSYPGQDPIVEEAIRTLVDGRPTKDLWSVWLKMKQLWEIAENQESKVIIGWLRTWIPHPFDNWPSWVFKRCFCPHLLSPEEGPGLPEPPEKDFRCFFYDPLYVPYLKAIGRYEEALERFRQGTLPILYKEVYDYFEGERSRLFEDAEKYDPDITITWLYSHFYGRVYYSTTIKTEKEYRVWLDNILSHETLARVSHLKDKLSEKDFDELYKKTRTQVYLLEDYKDYEGKPRAFSDQPTTYLIALLSKRYYEKGDLATAIYYAEWHLSREDPVTWGYVDSTTETIDLSAVKVWRTRYLKKLKADGEVDKLYPFIYIEDKPLDPRKGFTKNGEPYVAVFPFCKALNKPAEWIRKGNLLRIKNDSEISIANIKGRWKIYSDEGVKKINAYLKEGEIYLPLKELCQLLNLELQWDEETFIARVFKK
ncbi:hypothetical protein H5T87_01710 [bacterium]|nr:hypothetical protein [bacterium]